MPEIPASGSKSSYADNKVHGANPSVSCRPQVGSTLAPWTLLSGYISFSSRRVFTDGWNHGQFGARFDERYPDCWRLFGGCSCWYWSIYRWPDWWDRLWRPLHWVLPESWLLHPMYHICHVDKTRCWWRTPSCAKYWRNILTRKR